MAIIHVSDKDFENEVLKSTQPVLVDFWATWCGPCQMLAPILEDVVKKTDAKIAKIDVDAYPQLAIHFGVSSIPTLILFKNGKIAKTSVGLISEEQIISLLNS